MGITNSNKTISVDRIECDGTLRVTLALTAAPDIVTNPTDIALVLDRSGSMTGTPLTNMKAGADTFIDIIAEATEVISCVSAVAVLEKLTIPIWLPEPI